MQFRDLKKQYQALKQDIDQAMLTVAADCNFINGAQVQELEQALCDYVGIKHCVTCANGTDALTLALMAWGVGKGDAVFVPDFTFFSSGEVVSLAGATPVFFDVKRETFNADVNSLEEAIRGVIADGNLTPKAVIAVDLFGLPADFPAIRKLTEKYGLLLLEDGAQGFGGAIHGEKACSFGDISTTSFFPAKPLGCYGDGGAVFTNDDNIAELLKSIRVHGKGTFKYDNIRIGLNSRLDTLQAAILLPKLKAFQDYELEAVNRAAQTYTKLLGDVVETPIVPDGFYSSWAQYSILLKDKAQRDHMQNTLKQEGIPSMIYYPKPMHEQEAFKGAYLCYGDMKNTKELCERVLALPMHPYLEDREIEQVVEAIKRGVRRTIGE